MLMYVIDSLKMFSRSRKKSRKKRTNNIREKEKKKFTKSNIWNAYSNNARISSLVDALGVPTFPLLLAPLLGGVARSGGGSR